jgi:hypothetical protein
MKKDLESGKYRESMEWKKCEFCKHQNFEEAIDCTACGYSFDPAFAGQCPSCTFLDNPKDAGKCQFCGARLYSLHKRDNKY